MENNKTGATMIDFDSEKIKKMARDKHFSDKQLGMICGYSDGGISSSLTRGRIRLDALEKICEFFGVKVESVLKHNVTDYSSSNSIANITRSIYELEKENNEMLHRIIHFLSDFVERQESNE